jgi:hypothetical protein
MSHQLSGKAEQLACFECKYDSFILMAAFAVRVNYDHSISLRSDWTTRFIKSVSHDKCRDTIVSSLGCHPTILGYHELR